MFGPFVPYLPSRQDNRHRIRVHDICGPESHCLKRERTSNHFIEEFQRRKAQEKTLVESVALYQSQSPTLLPEHYE